MKVKATVCFSGKISMREGEERNIPEGDTLTDLLKAGYVKEVGNKKQKNKDADNSADTDEDVTEDGDSDEAQ